MLIKSNKGSNCIPPLRNTINDEHLDEMVYDDDKKCELLNKYFSLVSKLEEENIPIPPFESKTNGLRIGINISSCNLFPNPINNFLLCNVYS
jgi:hypothetical protein